MAMICYRFMDRRKLCPALYHIIAEKVQVHQRTRRVALTASQYVVSVISHNNLTSFVIHVAISSLPRPLSR